jgi:hypothetical protein
MHRAIQHSDAKPVPGTGNDELTSAHFMVRHKMRNTPAADRHAKKFQNPITWSSRIAAMTLAIVKYNPS